MTRKLQFPIFLLLFILFSTPLFAQKDIKIDNLNIHHTANNQQIFILPSNQGENVYFNLNYRVGPIFEYDSVNGLSLVLSELIHQKINQSITKNGAHVQFEKTLTPDLLSFKFISKVEDLDKVIHLINTVIIDISFTENDLQNTISILKKKYETVQESEEYVTARKVEKMLWVREFQKLNNYGNGDKYELITLKDIYRLHSKYFLPQNSSITVCGNINPDFISKKIDAGFENYLSTEFNPEQITRVFDFKPLINTNQVLNIKDVSNSELNIIYQNPGARSSRRSSYCAFLLSEMLNDKNGKMAAAISKSNNLKNFKAVYDCQNYFGSFSLNANIDNSNFNTAFEELNQLLLKILKTNFITENELEVSKKNIADNFENFKTKNPNAFLENIAKYRFLNDDFYFTSLSDSIQNVKLSNMNEYIKDYFFELSGLRILTTNANQLKSASSEEQFYEQDLKSIQDLKITFDNNKYDLEGEQNLLAVNKAINWMKTNPDNYVQVNGFADEGEYEKVKEVDVLNFIDSTPAFKKAMPDIFFKKRYLRPEMTRAMKIMMKIYQSGIPINRITGTSMKLSSDPDEKEKKKANRYATFTIEKIKNRPSLLEYHTQNNLKK